MSNQHKNPTISFRVSEYERNAIEAHILASGMMKKDYFVRSCIYNQICVVGKKEMIYPLVEVLRKLYLQFSCMLLLLAILQLHFQHPRKSRHFKPNMSLH